MSTDNGSVELQTTPEELEQLCSKMEQFSGTLDDNEQVMLSAILALAEDQSLRRRLRRIGTLQQDGESADVQGFGMTINSTQSSLFESTNEAIDSTSRPIILCGSGTAQVNRVWAIMERLGEAGCLDRVQSAILYDINSDTRRRSASKARDIRSRRGTQIFQPEYIPSDDGFHRNAQGYTAFAGRLLQEQESIVEDVSKRAAQIGTAPQLIIHLMGFGSHSILGAKLHNRLTEEFPDTKTVVILGVPRDPTLHEGMRAVWDEFISLLPGQGFLITDDRIGDPVVQDHKLACAIASIEASAQSGMQSGPTLTDVISSLSQEKDGKWLGITSIKSFEMPMTTTWSMIPPFRRTKLVRGKVDELNMMPVKSIKAAMNDRWQLADHRSPDNESRSMVVCTVPLKNDEIPRMNAQVQELLQYDGFFEKNPRTTVSFASAQMSSNVLTKQVPNLPNRRNFVVKGVIYLGRRVWGSVNAIGGSIFGRKPSPLYIHCSRIYTIPGATDPAREIGTLNSILMSKEMEPQRDAGNEPGDYLATALNGIFATK